ESLPESQKRRVARIRPKAASGVGGSGLWFHCTVVVWPRGPGDRFAYPGGGSRARAGRWLGVGTRCLLPSMSPGSGLHEAGASSFTSGQQASHPGLDRCREPSGKPEASRSPDKAEGRIRGAGPTRRVSLLRSGLAAWSRGSLRLPGLRNADSGWGVAGYRDAMPAALHVPRLRPPRGRSLLLYFRATGIASRPRPCGSLPEKPEASKSRSPDKAEG